MIAFPQIQQRYAGLVLDERGVLRQAGEDSPEIEININFGDADAYRSEIVERIARRTGAESLSNGYHREAMAVTPPDFEGYSQTLAAMQRSAGRKAEATAAQLESGFNAKVAEAARDAAESQTAITTALLSATPADGQAQPATPQPATLTQKAAETGKKCIEWLKNLPAWQKYALLGLAAVGVIALLYVTLDGKEGAN